MFKRGMNGSGLVDFDTNVIRTLIVTRILVGGGFNIKVLDRSLKIGAY